MKLTSEAVKALKEQLEVLFSDNACSELFHNGAPTFDEIKEICEIRKLLKEIDWISTKTQLTIMFGLGNRKNRYPNEFREIATKITKEI